MSHESMNAAPVVPNAYVEVRPMGATAEYTAPGTVFTGENGALVPYAPASTEVVAHTAPEASANPNQEGSDALAAWRVANGHKENLSDMTGAELDAYMKDKYNATDDQIRRSQMTPDEVRKEQDAKALEGRKAIALEGRKDARAIEAAKPKRTNPAELLSGASQFAKDKAAYEAQVELEDESRLNEARKEITEREKRLAENRSDADKAVRAARGYEDEEVEPPFKITDKRHSARKKPEGGDGGDDGGDKAPVDKSEKQATSDEMAEDLGKRGGLNKKEAKALKDAQERYTRIAARRDAISTFANSSDKNKKGSSEKLMAEAQAELLELRQGARATKRKALEKLDKYSKDEIDAFLAADDTKFVIKTSKKITDKEIANFEKKLPKDGFARKAVNKWKSWGKYELKKDGTYKLNKAGERIVKPRGKRAASFAKKAGLIVGLTVAGSFLLPSTVVTAPVLYGGLYAGRTKVNQMAERVDRAKARHARLTEYFQSDAGLQASRKTGNYVENALNETSNDVNKYVTHNRRVLGLGTLGVAAASMIPLAIQGAEHAFGGHHVAAHHNVPSHTGTGHPSGGGHTGGGHTGGHTTNVNTHPWTVAHNMNHLDKLHTNEMADIRHVIDTQNALGHHYALTTLHNGNQILVENGRSTAAATHAFNRALIDYMNTLKG